LRLKITPLASLQLRLTGLPGVPGAAGAAGAQGPPGAAGGTLTDGDKGDITVSSSGAVWTIDNQVVTYAKMQNVSATSRVHGRITAGAGVTEELTGANVKTIVGSGDLTKTDDTNVTLTLGGTPTAALYSATSLTLGWSGTLSVARGGTGAGSFTAFAVLCAGTTSTSAFQPIASVGTAGQILTSNGAGALPTFQAAGAATGTPVTPQGRLTLQTLVPVMVTNQAAKTTLFYTPYVGAVVPLYNGTSFAMTAFTELSVQTTDTTKSPAAIGVNKVNDWFVWSDGGTIRLGHGPDWTNDSTRSAGTALVMVNGILLNNAAITNGPAASRGTYVGTTRSNGSSQLDWIFGAVAANGTAAFFGVWNAYNRRKVFSITGDSTDSWTYATVLYRPSNNSTTMRASFVSGLAEDAFISNFRCPCSGTSGAAIAVAFDVTNAVSGCPAEGNNAFFTELNAVFGGATLGFHFFQAIECAVSASSVTFYGDFGDVFHQNGLLFEGWM
jgi:hypothetical protein